MKPMLDFLHRWRQARESAKFGGESLALPSPLLVRMRRASFALVPPTCASVDQFLLRIVPSPKFDQRVYIQRFMWPHAIQAFGLRLRLPLRRETLVRSPSRRPRSPQSLEQKARDRSKSKPSWSPPGPSRFSSAPAPNGSRRPNPGRDGAATCSKQHPRKDNRQTWNAPNFCIRDYESSGWGIDVEFSNGFR